MSRIFHDPLVAIDRVEGPPPLRGGSRFWELPAVYRTYARIVKVGKHLVQPFVGGRNRILCKTNDNTPRSKTGSKVSRAREMKSFRGNLFDTQGETSYNLQGLIR